MCFVCHWVRDVLDIVLAEKFEIPVSGMVMNTRHLRSGVTFHLEFDQAHVLWLWSDHLACRVLKDGLEGRGVQVERMAGKGRQVAFKVC